MKITLNTTSVPENRRPEVEALAKSISRDAVVVWLPSRFPRFVMLVEPGHEDKSPADSGSIFEEADEDMHSLAAITESLEDRIKASLAKPASTKSQVGALL